LPCSLYGCNVWRQLPLKVYEMLEVIQRYFSKKIQGLPKQTASLVSLDNLKLRTIQAYIDKQALLLLGRLCRSSCGYYFKQLFIGRLAQYICNGVLNNRCYRSPCFNMFRLIQKYSLCDDVNEYIMSSNMHNKAKWSLLINNNIQRVESIEVMRQISARQDLRRYASIRSDEFHRIWILCQRFPHKFSALATLVRIGSSKMQSRECRCGIVAHDFIRHILMSCNINLQERNDLFERICDIINVDYFVMLWSNDDDDILSFLLGGMPHGVNKIEFETWANIMLIVAEYVMKWKPLFMYSYSL